jgi:hypothetical protein
VRNNLEGNELEIQRNGQDPNWTVKPVVVVAAVVVVAGVVV